jgi:hypothetical protein
MGKTSTQLANNNQRGIVVAGFLFEKAKYYISTNVFAQAKKPTFFVLTMKHLALHNFNNDDILWKSR